MTFATSTSRLRAYKIVRLDAEYFVNSVIENVNTNLTMTTKMKDFLILVKKEVTNCVCSLEDI